MWDLAKNGPSRGREVAGVKENRPSQAMSPPSSVFCLDLQQHSMFSVKEGSFQVLSGKGQDSTIRSLALVKGNTTKWGIVWFSYYFYFSHKGPFLHAVYLCEEIHAGDSGFVLDPDGTSHLKKSSQLS